MLTEKSCHYRNIECTFYENKKAEPAQSVQERSVTSGKELGCIQKQQAASSKKQEVTIVGSTDLYFVLNKEFWLRYSNNILSKSRRLVFYASLDGRFIYIKNSIRRRKLHKKLQRLKKHQDFNLKNKVNLIPPIQFRKERQS